MQKQTDKEPEQNIVYFYSSICRMATVQMEL